MTYETFETKAKPVTHTRTLSNGDEIRIIIEEYLDDSIPDHAPEIRYRVTEQGFSKDFHEWVDMNIEDYPLDYTHEDLIELTLSNQEWNTIPY